MMCGFRITLSHVAKGEASSHHKAKSPPVKLFPPTQPAPLIQPTPTTQPQSGVVSQLLPTLMPIQKNLQHLAGIQVKQAQILVQFHQLSS